MLPSANAGVVSVRPHLAGSASGLGGAMMIGGGALLSAGGAQAGARRLAAPRDHVRQLEPQHPHDDRRNPDGEAPRAVASMADQRTNSAGGPLARSTAAPS